jgi:chromosome segregation ATPase
MTDTSENGNGKAMALPESRKAAVTQAAEYYQELHQQKDELEAEVARLKVELAGYKVTVEVLQAQVNDAESKLASAIATVDQHKAARLEFESLFVSCQALFRAFKVPNLPTVRELQDQIDDSEGRT